MIANRTRIASVALATALLALLATSGARAAAPVKLVLSSHIGWEVNQTTKGSICTVASKDVCQPAKTTGEPAGFENPPQGIAGALNGNVYFTEAADKRVKELTANGEFVLMFGKDVNEKTHGDLCTEEEIKASPEVKCQAGGEGGSAGVLSQPESVAVDPLAPHNVYVQDYANARVDEYTADGEFLLMIGKEVNQTEDETAGAGEAEKNLCTAASKDTCKAGVKAAIGSTEKGAFNFPESDSDILAVGGASGDLLYVGDERRVQEFDAQGEWKGEIKLSAATISTAPGEFIRAMVVDPETNDVYVVYGLNDNVIHEFDSTTGEELKSFEVDPREAEGHIEYVKLTVDASGHLVVEGTEEDGSTRTSVGFLYEAAGARLLTEFTFPSSTRAFVIGSSGNGEVYGSAYLPGPEILRFTPEPVAELVTGSAACKAGPEVETSDTFTCTLNGEVNPYGVPGTEAWFEWGRTCSLGSDTARNALATLEAPLPVSAAIEGLRPNESFCYQLTGYDSNLESPEQLIGARASVSTKELPPKIVGGPSATFVTTSSAVLSGELNPENAPTEFFFEYGSSKALADCPGLMNAECPGVSSTSVLQSEFYGRTGATFEATGLQPATEYAYRLAAGGQGGESPPGPVGDFTTAPAREPTEQTFPASAVTQTSAVASGTVDPEGQVTTYAFELGVYEGPSTQYGVVFSGRVGGGAPVEESLPLRGLQPGTTYAYRIAVSSGYVKDASQTLRGAPVTFTTAGLPSALVVPAVLAQLASPPVAFPQGSGSVTPKKLTRAQQLAAALKACAKKPRKQRSSCRRVARKKYAVSKTKAKKK
jgi:hypothetical protein